jgi:radical SAM protein with 4Fe4S-binding SPASM domain
MFYYSTKFNSDDDEVNAIACNPGSSQLYVHHNGNIYPCPNLQKECFFMGHINDLSSKQINNILQRRLPVFDIIESLKTVNLDKCKDCTYKLFCGYCVSNVMNMLESDEIFSYNCEKLKTLIFN